MELINTLNLSEIMNFFESEEDINNLFKRMEKENFPPSRRIFLGSNFCSIFFTRIDIKYYFNIIKFALNNNLNITLVVPIINEGLFEKAINRIEELEPYFDYIDEITVNDYGMLTYIKDKYPKMKINLGRLLNKDTRDVRYKDFTEIRTIPDNLTFDKILLDDTKINSLEIDVTHSNIDLNNTKYVIGVHVPYLYQTYGHICEYASIGLKDEKKFRPNHLCDFECKRTFIKYKSDVANYIKFGRTVYTKVNVPNIFGKDSVRMIYFPLDYLEREKDE